MADINLDALRKARAEQQGEKHTVRLGGKKFALPAELPIEFAVALAEGRIQDALRAVFDGRYEAFWELKPSVADYEALASGIAELYTGKAPNPEASGSSS